MAAMNRSKPKKLRARSKRDKPGESPKLQERTLARTGTDFPVVGIGASAGGLEALEELFDNMPPETGMSFVVVTHQHPGHTSLLPELLGRQTGMGVTEAVDGVTLEPNHVYVGPPAGYLTVV